MALTAIDSFLLSFAVAIATATSLSADETPRAIWSTEAVEGEKPDATKINADVYTVFRIYGGAEPPVFKGMRRITIDVQADTRGEDSQAVMAQAWNVHEAMLDSNQDQGQMAWAIAGKVFDTDDSIKNDPDGNWLIRTVDFLTGPPGIRGRDEAGRWMATNNVRLRIERAA